MKLITKEKVWTDSEGAKHYYREETLVSDDEYFTRKYSEAYPRSSLRKIFDSYHDYKESREWD